jgi:malonyl-CoA O-methyltransferase
MHHLTHKPHAREFDTKAKGYDSRRVIQNALADIILLDFDSDNKKIVDIGCGSGAIFERVHDFKSFLAVDISANFLALHPRNDAVTLMQADFDDDTLYGELSMLCLDTVVSNSSIQWSEHIEKTLRLLSSLASECRISFFTDGTFRKLREIAKTDNFLPNANKIVVLLDKLGFEKVDKHEFILHFDEKKEIFDYIKKSGIGGGKRTLDFKAAKLLRNSYPYDYLEFEAVTAIRSNSSFSAS